MITKNHHFYLLNLSPWPLICMFSSLNLFFSLGLFFKFYSVANFIAALLISIFGSFMWWWNYLIEFSFKGMNSLDLESGIKMGMILFISSEIFFFFSFFWSYFHFFLSPGEENGFNWPPSGLVSFEALNFPFLNTLILLSSGLTATLSHWFLINSKYQKSQNFLMITIFLGLTFTLFQVVEYSNSFFSINDGNFGSTFFMLTGFHGLHVVLGTIFLLFSLYLCMKLTSPVKVNFLSFELACWYWHFVDVVWIFLFFFLYYLNN